eukprot:CAMPEP_0169270834 /NCGR_PEP_ID=MMETSP1016-20121227/49371_1 /TAXON_ID=342587 /ORGANISM="Karlodinium micrum, Strain CCMP2283" /LENGTH=79 /DNA_ID=CAMNT_0009356291 /DNA_START=326 /DNA_END=562 /DNA_ORIENTATION=-
MSVEENTNGPEGNRYRDIVHSPDPLDDARESPNWELELQDALTYGDVDATATEVLNDFISQAAMLGMETPQDSRVSTSE